MLSLPFSGATAAAIRTASWVAYQHSHNTTGPEHLLHGALEADGSRVNQLLRLASNEDAFDLWHLTWPDGIRRPSATPPLNPLARAAIEYTTAEARIRGAAVVTTGDLLRVLMRTTAPGLDRFFSALEFDRELAGGDRERAGLAGAGVPSRVDSTKCDPFPVGPAVAY